MALRLSPLGVQQDPGAVLQLLQEDCLELNQQRESFQFLEMKKLIFENVSFIFPILYSYINFYNVRFFQFLSEYSLCC